MSETGVGTDSLGDEAWDNTRSLVNCLFERGARPFHNPFTCLRKDTRRCETEVSLRSTSCWELIETVVWDGIKVLEGMMVGRLLDGLER